MHRFLFLIFFSVPFISSSQTLDYLWAVNGNQSGNFCRTRDVATDASGNTFVLIQYSEPVQFGTISLANIGAEDIAVVKINAAGITEWAAVAGGTGNEDASSICTDNSSIYVSGSYSDAANFGTQSVVSDNPNVNEDRPEFFVAKLNDAGQWQWVRNQDGNANSQATAITTDNSGNVIAGGIFFGADLQIGATTLPSVFDQLPFIVKYNASGAVQWLKGPSTDYGALLDDIACDGLGNIFVAGSFGTFEIEEVTLTMGSVELVNAGDAEVGLTARDLFIIKLSAAGDAVWGLNAGALSYETYARSIEVANDDIIYVSGTFQGSITGGSITKNVFGGEDDIDVFVASISPAGNWDWITAVGNESANSAAVLKIASDDHIFLAGSLDGGVYDFGNFTMTSAADKPNYIARLNADGSWRWGIPHPSISGFSPLDNNRFRISGQYSGSLTLGTFTLTATGGASSDVYVTAVDYDPEDPESTGNPFSDSTPMIFPVPATLFQTLMIKDERITSVSCFDLAARQVNISATVSGNAVEIRYSDEMPAGIYMIRLQTDKNVYFVKTQKADL